MPRLPRIASPRHQNRHNHTPNAASLPEKSRKGSLASYPGRPVPTGGPAWLRVTLTAMPSSHGATIHHLVDRLPQPRRPVMCGFAAITVPRVIFTVSLPQLY